MGALKRDVPAFAPHRLLRNPHLQTVFAALPVVARDFRKKLQELRIPIGNGEALGGIALWSGDDPRPTALVIHGMGGSIESAYVVRAVRAIAAAGFHAVAIDLRGVGTSLATTSGLYHSGLAEDVDAAVRWLANDRRVSTLLVVGFSLGGHVSLVLASRWGSAVPRKVAGVVAISPPMDLAENSRRIEHWKATPYRAYVLRGLKENAIEVRARAPHRFRLDERGIRSLRRIWDFDDAVVAPMHGFRDASHYYEVASAGPKLGNVEVSTLVLSAEDDPMIPADTIRPYVAEASPAVRIAWSPLGGHVGFFEGLGSFEKSWAIAQVVTWLEEIRDRGNSDGARPMEG